MALFLRSPELFRIWFWENNIGRFVGFSVPTLGAESELGYWWKTYPWFLFPGWIFVVATFWKLRRVALRQPAVQIGILLTVTLGLVLGVSASARAIYALPMLVPVALMGAGSIGELPRWIDNVLTSIGLGLTAVACALFWFLWGYLILRGHSPEWPWLIKALPAQFDMPFSLTSVTFALLLISGALLWNMSAWKNKRRGLYVWCASLALAWGLAATLCLPWIDAAKSYRAMYESMRSALPIPMTCLRSQGLGESERAMLSYVLGIDSHQEEIGHDPSCNAMIMLSHATENQPVIDPDWILAWSGTRPGDTNERFQLYVLSSEALRTISSVSGLRPSIENKKTRMVDEAASGAFLRTDVRSTR